MRTDHFNVLVPDVEVAYEHYRQLGFRTTELIADDAPDGRKYGVWLTRARIRRCRWARLLSHVDARGKE